MKKFLKLFLIFLLTLSAVRLARASVEDLFMKANEAYRTGDYQKAIERYTEVVKEEPQAAVYYNMGNAAFKLNRIGQAILNYERARRLSPRDQDTIQNLKYVKTLVEYRAEDKRPLYQRAVSRMAGYVSLKESGMMVVLLYFALVSLVLIHFLTRGRFGLGRVGVLVLMFFAAATFVASFKFYEKRFQKKAVVTASKMDVRFGPSSEDRLAFSLGEGIEVRIDDELNGWYRVNLVSGESGCVQKNGVEAV